MHAALSTHFPDHSAVAKPLNTALQQISFSPLSLALHSLYDRVLEFEKICKWDVVCVQIGGFKQRELLHLADDLRVDIFRQRLVLEKGALANKFNPIYLCHKDFNGDDWVLGDQKYVSTLDQRCAELVRGFEFMKGSLEVTSQAHDKIQSLIIGAEEKKENAVPASGRVKLHFAINLSSIFSGVTLALEAFKTEFSKQFEAATKISEIANGLKQSEPDVQQHRTYTHQNGDLDFSFLDFPTGSR